MYDLIGDHMKRVFYIIILIIGIGVVLVCNWPKVEVIENDVSEKRSVFISYIELSKYLNGKGSEDGKRIIENMILNVKDFGFNEVILQVRSFSDAIYRSDIYPWSMVVSSSEGVDPGYDVLKHFIDVCHREKLSLVAWINPYRIRNNEDIEGLSIYNPAYKYLGTSTVYINNGIYFNPSKKEVVDLIVSGVKEIIDNYDVDGILFDDYFYPDNNIDEADYYRYLASNEYITKEEYNLNVVSEMIKNVYSVCKEKGVKFGVSPDGNMENNYNKVFADVKKWCSSDEYIDFIMPQVYYGFYNETKAFKKTIDEWESIVVNKDIDLVIALAFYKNGLVDEYARSGRLEWINNNDIIMREIVISRNLDNYIGFSLFRYDYIFDKTKYTDMTYKEIENIKKILN